MLRPADDVFLNLACERGLITAEQERWVRRRLQRADLKARHICVEQGWLSRARALAIREDVIAILAENPGADPAVRNHLRRNAAPTPPRTIPWLPFALAPALLFALSPLAFPRRSPPSRPPEKKVARRHQRAQRPPKPRALPPAPRPRALRPRTASIPALPLTAPEPPPLNILTGRPAEAVDTLRLQAARAEAEEAWGPAAFFLERCLENARPEDIGGLRERLERAQSSMRALEVALYEPGQKNHSERWRALLEGLLEAHLQDLPSFARAAEALLPALDKADAVCAALHRDALALLDGWAQEAADSARELPPHLATIELPGQLQGRFHGVDEQDRLLVILDAGHIAIAPQELPLPQILALLTGPEHRLRRALLCLYSRQHRRALSELAVLEKEPLARRFIDHQGHCLQTAPEPEAPAPIPAPKLSVSEAIADHSEWLIRDASSLEIVHETSLAAVYDFTTGLKALSPRDWQTSGTPPRPDALVGALHLDGVGQAAHRLVLGGAGTLDLSITINRVPAARSEFRLILRAADGEEAWIAPFAQQLLHRRRRKLRARAGFPRRRLDLLQAGRTLRLTIGRDDKRIYAAIDGELSAEIATKKPNSPLRIGFAWSNVSLDLHALRLQIQPEIENSNARIQDP